MQTKVELYSVLDHATVQRRQQHMVVIVESGHRNHEQTVILACVTVHESRAAVCSRAVCAQQLLLHHSLQVGHRGPFKLQITHIVYIWFVCLRLTWCRHASVVCGRPSPLLMPEAMCGYGQMEALPLPPRKDLNMML